MKFGERLLQAWYQGHPALYLLWPLEQLYRSVVKRKRQQFINGETQTYRAPVPVIVVGNITVGGTGKTPLILWLIEQCQAQGVRVGVVSRGYGARPPSFPWTVSATDSAEQAGDEPLLIVQRSGVPLVIAPERAQAVQQLLAEHTANGGAVLGCDDEDLGALVHHVLDVRVLLRGLVVRIVENHVVAGVLKLVLEVVAVFVPAFLGLGWHRNADCRAFLESLGATGLLESGTGGSACAQTGAYRQTADEGCYLGDAFHLLHLLRRNVQRLCRDLDEIYSQDTPLC